MIFKLKDGSIPLSSVGESLYLLIEGDANGIFFGVYDNVDKAKRCNGALGLRVVSLEDMAICANESYPLHFGAEENPDKRIVKE